MKNKGKMIIPFVKDLNITPFPSFIKYVCITLTQLCFALLLFLEMSGLRVKPENK